MKIQQSCVCLWQLFPRALLLHIQWMWPKIERSLRKTNKKVSKSFLDHTFVQGSCVNPRPDGLLTLGKRKTILFPGNSKSLFCSNTSRSKLFSATSGLLFVFLSRYLIPDIWPCFLCTTLPLTGGLPGHSMTGCFPGSSLSHSSLLENLFRGPRDSFMNEDAIDKSPISSGSLLGITDSVHRDDDKPMSCRLSLFREATTACCGRAGPKLLRAVR